MSSSFVFALNYVATLSNHQQTKTSMPHALSLMGSQSCPFGVHGKLVSSTNPNEVHKTSKLGLYPSWTSVFTARKSLTPPASTVHQRSWSSTTIKSLVMLTESWIRWHSLFSATYSHHLQSNGQIWSNDILPVLLRCCHLYDQRPNFRMQSIKAPNMG